MRDALVGKFRQLVASRFHRSRAWTVLDEFPVDVGRKGKGRIDVFALRFDGTRPIQRVAYEIKVNRSDFIQECRQPEKRHRAQLVSDRYYFVVPKGLVHICQIPPGCGLVEVGDDLSIEIMKRAPRLHCRAWSLRLARAVEIRAAQIARRETPLEFKEILGWQFNRRRCAVPMYEPVPSNDMDIAEFADYGD